MPPWRNRLARSAVNRKVGGSSPPGGGILFRFASGKRPKKSEASTQAGFEPAIF